MASARRLESGRPSPVPSMALGWLATRSKGTKSRSMASAGDAQPGVGDLDAQPAAGHRLAVQVDAAALAVVLDGVGQQVEQDLLEPLAVAEDVGGAGHVRAGQHDVVRVGQRPDQADRLGGHVGQGDRLERQRQPPGLDGGDVQDLVDEAEQVPRPREDVAQVVALLVVHSFPTRRSSDLGRAS